MSKSAIFAELAKTTDLLGKVDASTNSVQPASELNSFDWLTRNFDSSNTSWQSVNSSISAITKAIKAWYSGYKLASETPAIHISGQAYSLLGVGSTGLTLRLYNKPELSQPFGITMASAALAETGTLVMHSAIDNPPSLHFLCDHHCVLLWRKDIFRFYEDYWQQQSQFASRLRALNFVSGPSRTADVEQTIQLGAHGPLSLHVLIVGK